MNSIIQQTSPKIPKDFVKAPIFPAKRQQGARIIRFGSKVYTIGGTHPIDKNRVVPALDIRHFRLLLCLLTFIDENSPLPTINLSLNELADRYAENNGGEYNRYLKTLLADLADCWFSVLDEEKGERRGYRVLDDINTREKFPRRRDARAANNDQLEMWLENVVFHKKFLEMLMQIEELCRIRFDVLNKIKTPLAQSIYTYIPSRAVHHTKDSPWEITATNLLKELGETVSEEKKRRREKFAAKRDGRPSIIDQLDGQELIKGKLRVKIVETEDKRKSDWKLQFWAEGVEDTLSVPKNTNSESPLLEAFVSSGKGDQKEFDRIIKNRSSLSGYESDLLRYTGIDYRDSEKFLEMVKAIIGGERFQTILAELKGNILEPNSKIKSPARILNKRLMKAINPSYN